MLITFPELLMMVMISVAGILAVQKEEKRKNERGSSLKPGSQAERCKLSIPRGVGSCLDSLSRPAPLVESCFLSMSRLVNLFSVNKADFLLRKGSQPADPKNWRSLRKERREGNRDGPGAVQYGHRYGRGAPIG